MKVALALLLILAAACAGGSFITQGQTYAWYEAYYSKTAAGLIMALGLDDVFHTWWFILLAAFLCINLLACNLLRLPALVRRSKSGFSAEKRIRQKSALHAVFDGQHADEAVHTFFEKMGFKKLQKGTAENVSYVYAAKNKAGLWGAWVCHLGILLLIIGFGAGQMNSIEYTVYGVPGQTKQIGDTGYLLSIEDFTVDLREDDTVRQYEAELTVSSTADGSRQEMTVSVNHPASAYGMKYYQNSMGWAATLHVRKDGDEEDVQTEVVCQGESVSIEAVEGLIIYLQGIYPDYYQDEDGMPATASNDPANPGYLYRAVYNGETMQMNVLYGEPETNEIYVNDEYAIWFDEPRYYTLIQIKKDPFEKLALLGGLIVLLGLLLSFYVQPEEIWAAAGEDGAVHVYGAGRKGGALFAERFRQTARSGGARLELPEDDEMTDQKTRPDMSDRKE